MEGRAEGISTSRSAWMLLSFHAGRVEEDTAARYSFILYSHTRQTCTLIHCSYGTDIYTERLHKVS